MNTNNSYEITFETKCYENDWEYILKTKYLNRMINNCNIHFSLKHVIINNIKQRDTVEYYVQKKIREKVIDAYYFVDDYIKKALIFFDINRETFGKGYYYSSAELVGLYVTKTKYLLHFASDVFMPYKYKNNWITEACKIFEKEPNIVVANPTWNFHFNEAKEETDGNTIDNFYIGYGGFSDQCYLVRTDNFREKIYNFRHPASERYPKYGGELFEKRVDSYMRVSGKQRIISKKESYIHNNFPNKKLYRKMVRFMIVINVYNYICILNIKSRMVILKIKIFIKKWVKGRHGI
jgi:hypothetical protein